MPDVNTQATEPTNQPTNPTTTDPITEPKNQKPDGEGQQADPKQKEPTMQEMMVEMAKLKRSQEKAASEAAEWKKKYTATLSEKDQLDQAKAEAEAKRDEEFKTLQRKVKINDLTNSFLKLGYGDSAEKAAIAQADGDTDALFKIQAEVDAAKKKSWEAEFYKNRPQPQAGVSGEKATMTKEEFTKLLDAGKYVEVMQFKEKYPETYTSYMK